MRTTATNNFVAPAPGRPAGSSLNRRCNNWLLMAAWGFILPAAISCSAFVSPTPGLHPIADISARGWIDDGSADSLERAIDRSIGYYQGLPRATRLRYGDLAYSPSEMIASLELFGAMARQPQSLGQNLARHFHVFESVPPSGGGLVTGYYEPVLAGSHNPGPELSEPVLTRPKDLVEVHLSRFGGELPPRRLVGRLKGGELLPYYNRREIQQGGARLEGSETLAYVSEVDLFFLQIQGSGRIRFPGGRELRVSYDGTNGHPYRSLGAELVRRGAISDDEVSMQSIRAYLHANPRLTRELLFTNPSYIFFKPVEEGPLGNIQVPLTPGRSLALDHRLFPKGGLAYLEADIPVAGESGQTRTLRRFFLVQDTGGAISGHGRADIFWGIGREAEWIAGHLKHPGRLFLLVAKKEALQTTVPEGG